jgi:hypothetical protein
MQAHLRAIWCGATQVTEWILASTRVEWSSAEWQRHVASPEAFYAAYVDLQPDALGVVQVWKTLWWLQVCLGVCLTRKAAFTRTLQLLGMSSHVCS